MTLTWLFYFLARTPAAQQRVRDEVDAVLGSETPTYHHLRALAHIDKVCVACGAWNGDYAG